MTDAILISIQPESAEKIPSDGKKFEFRGGGIYNINSYSKNIYSLFPLFPFYRTTGLWRHIEYHPVDTFHFFQDSVCYVGKE